MLTTATLFLTKGIKSLHLLKAV